MSLYVAKAQFRKGALGAGILYKRARVFLRMTKQKSQMLPVFYEG